MRAISFRNKALFSERNAVSRGKSFKVSNLFLYKYSNIDLYVFALLSYVFTFPLFAILRKIHYLYYRTHCLCINKIKVSDAVCQVGGLSTSNESKSRSEVYFDQRNS